MNKVKEKYFHAKGTDGYIYPYATSDFESGTVISVNGVEYFLIYSLHLDVYKWIDCNGQIFSEEEFDAFAERANVANKRIVTRVIHKG